MHAKVVRGLLTKKRWECAATVANRSYTLAVSPVKIVEVNVWRIGWQE